MEKLLLMVQQFIDDPLRVYLVFIFICFALIAWRVNETLKEQEERERSREKLTVKFKERNLYDHKIF